MFEPVETLTIEEAVKEVLNSNNCLNEDCISIFEILSIYQEVKQSWQNFKKTIEAKIDVKIKKVNINYNVMLHDFDFEGNEICLSVYRLPNPKETKFYFKINETIISLCNVQGAYKEGLENILSLIGEEIGSWYNYCWALKEVECQNNYGIKSVNSIFTINISLTCIDVYYGKNQFIADFRMLSLYEENNSVYLECKCDNIIELLRGKKYDFFKKIFVKISECPKWMQEKLNLIRKVELEKIEQERISKEQAEKAEQERIAKEQAEKAEQERIAKEQAENAEHERITKEQEEKAEQERIAKEQAELTREQKIRRFWKKIFPFIK